MINNELGLCGPDWSCADAVPDILYDDQMLTVRWCDKKTGELGKKELKGVRQK
ncbi:hypothetical protein [Kitasatospora sp. NPDC088351]|uniref:hypothetical protein n=1 Tax=Kitasatospora sp. NPDC088351 TaxID=3155180 RepID=UPI00343727F3